MSKEVKKLILAHDVDAEWFADVAFPLPIDESGDCRFSITTTGHGWNVITSIRGLVIDFKTREVHGVRTMHHPKESGYQMTGRVSVGGKKVRAFTSSTLLRVNGRLISVAVLYI
jgi:hypothetical protein